MKRRLLVIGLILAMAASSVQAQVTYCYRQDFESATPTGYSVSAGAATQTSIKSGGNKALKMTHTRQQEVVLTLDTMDFSDSAAWNYYTLEFMHIAYVDPLSCAAGDRTNVCRVEVKRPGQNNWTQLNSSYYRTEGGSSEFRNQGSFSKRTYDSWTAATQPSNTLWLQERFDIEQVFQGVPTIDRKLIIRFVVCPRSSNAGVDGWFIDDISVRASSQQMVAPTLTMISFPDNIKYPSSRGGRLVANFTTSVQVGVNPDSIYAEYKVGRSNTVHRAYLHRQSSGSSRFIGRIPFYGYDTLMTYHIVAKDSTRNNNTTYYPKNSNEWVTYRCVRGITHSTPMDAATSSNNTFPFPFYADNRSEFTYDSLLMAGLGFGPGAITSVRYQVATSPTRVTRPRVQIRMANIPNSQNRTSADMVFSTNTMQIVYDSIFVIDQASANSQMTITLQDTFFYSGSDLRVQIIYDGDQDVTATSIRHCSTPSNKMSVYLAGHESFYGYNAFSGDDYFNVGFCTNTRPWARFYEYKNVPLVYDCGVSGFAYPSYTTPCNAGTDSVVVWLKNFGVVPMNSVGLCYSVDGGTPVHHTWTGTLNGGDSCRVLMNASQAFTVGYHTIRAWVDDSITVNGVRVRDHEPYNDTSNSPFAVCNGAYSGTRTVGQAGANIPTLEKLLYALSRCGISAPLTVKLPAGTYDVTSFPYIPGTSATNYVLFEPATANARVTFRRTRRGDNNNAEALVDLTEARSIRFRNITFANGRYADNRCTTLALLGTNSNNCQFLNCTFVDSNAVAAMAEALIRTGEADSVLVENCVVQGGQTGVDVTGPSPNNRSRHNIVRFNEFSLQANTAISVVNQNDVWVDSNLIDDVQTNASFMILGQYLYEGSKITRNRIYSTKGASCIGVSDMHGTSTNYCLVANNMLASLDDGTSNQLTTPLNIIKGDYMRIVFNSVRMNAPSRVGVAAATFGSQVISDSYFENNIVACFDSNNYAFSFMPGNYMSSLHVDHNCYYSISGVLNRLYTDEGSTSYNSLAQWNRAITGESGSISCNPNFTNGSISRVDLRSFNSQLRGSGVAVPGVTTDILGISRPTNPSMGAYEVQALTVDFAPVAIITPFAEYCGAPSTIPVSVSFRNTGSGTYTYTPATAIRVYYKVDNGTVHNFSVNNRNCGPGDTITYQSTNTVSLPYGANNSDRTYRITWWVKCGTDPDDLNDTAVHTVVSRYAAAAPTVINQNVPYGTAATVTPTAGVDLWPVNFYTTAAARKQRAGISWYHSLNDEEKFYYGPSLTTTPLFADTTFYISQKRNLPLVKITEVQVNRTAAGATNPMPSFMNASTAFAVELTNVGDYPADLEGDSIIVVISNAAGKIWTLPNVTIQPHQCLVLQFKAVNTPSDSTRTIFAPSTAVVSPAYNANFGVIYRDGHGVADAVAFNSVTTASTSQQLRWSTQGISNTVWCGNGIAMGTTACAGARRISWPTNPTSVTASATQWERADATHLMQIGEVDNNLILYTDNGCEGNQSAVNLHVTGIPTTDLAVDEPVVDTGCNLTNAETVSVTIHNYGAQTANNVVAKYSLNGGATVAGSYQVGSITSQSQRTITFANTINMHANSDTNFNVKVWVDAVSTDARRSNDTNRATFHSRYTPNTPVVPATLSVNYANTTTITPTNFPTGRAKAVWFDALMNVLDTTDGAFTTPYIYHLDTFFCQYVALVDVPSTHVGNLTSTMNNNFPSPYNPKQKYVREQYLFTAAQLQAAGHGAGKISSISFFLNSLGNNVTSFNFSDYTIKMKAVSQTTFANATFITGATQVYHNTNLTLTAADCGWVHHKLDTPFIWNGTSSIVVEVVRMLSTSAVSAGANTKYTAQANTVITKQGSSDIRTATTGTKGNNRPDIIFGFMEPVGCATPTSQTLITVTGTPNNDATIEWPAGTDTMTVASCASTSLNVKLINRGSTNINAYTLRYKVDNGSWQQTTGNAQGLQLGRSRIVPLMSQSLTPGRHTVRAVIRVTGDNITSNDSIVHTFNVKFCGGYYTVGNNPGTRGYNTLAIALDTLANAGVAGNVTFLLKEQEHVGQFNIGAIPGASANSTVTFTTDTMASSYAVIKYTPTRDNNYVMKLDGADYVNFRYLDFYGNYTTGSGNNIYANVLDISNSSNITFNECNIRSKKSTAPSTNASLMLLGDNNQYITINHCLLDSGYYAIHTVGTNHHSHSVTVSNSDILNFWFRGIDIRNTDTVFVLHDSISAGVTVAGKPLIGVSIANANRVRVEKNFIYLVDNATGGKRGIQLANCKGTNIERVTIYNNMVSVRGTAVASLPSSCIWIDSTSKFVNVYFNTNKLYAGANQAATRTFSCQLSSNVHVLNNIFSNESKGYAYYVAIDTCVSNSNFNVYYSTSQPDTNARTGVITRKFARWGNNVDPISLDSLRIVNQKDVNSIEDVPYLIGDKDLRVALAQFAGVAQYNSDVPQDIFDSGRPQIPAPTIGAHEFNRRTTNVSIVEALEPKMPAITTGSNPTVYNIETDSIFVHARFYNNGNSAITGCSWYAFLLESDPVELSETRNLPKMNLRTMYEDSVRIASPYGMVDTQYVVIVLDVPDGTNDDDPSDNLDTIPFFIYPAYDLKVQAIAITNNEPAGCRLFDVPITYTIKNEGKKDFPGTAEFRIGYHYYCQGSVQPTSGFPRTFQGEYTSFGEGNDLPVGTTRDVTNTMHRPNLYPNGLLSDITVKLRGFAKYQYDVKPLNDTSSYISVTSNHTPPAPVGSDTTVDYGSYGNLWATETDGENNNHTPINRVIRWHRAADTTAGEYFYNGNNNYNRSTHWSSTPQYFHDSTYYLSCLSNKNCTSYYNPIHVGINAPLTHDVSISEVVSPRSSGRVYMELDTVKLRVANYGSSPITDIPIHYKWMNANGRQILGECDDTVRVTIPGRVGDNVSSTVFCFDTFLMVNQPLTNTTYQLQAWVSHPDDEQRGNDTLRTAHIFRSLAENTYDSILAFAPESPAGFDIIKVSYNTLDFELPDMYGRTSANMAHYTSNPDNAPVIYVTHGTTDTLSVTVANNEDEHDTTTTCSLCIAVDFNRDGQFDLNGVENLTKTSSTRGVRVTSRHTHQQVFTIPEAAQFGYMHMMVWVDGDNTAYQNGFRTQSTNGQIQQYMLFVQEPDSVIDVDAAISRVIMPAQHLIADTDSVAAVSVLLTNNGKQPLTSAQILGKFYNPKGNQFRTINWTGSLAPGTSEVVTFDTIVFNVGTTDLMARVIAEGDTIRNDNDSLWYRFHMNYVVELRFIDSFDQGISKWYIPEGFNNYSHNYFEIGTPAKSHINAPASQPNAFLTSATSVVTTGTRGNRSVIYTPIIDISQIQPDTITFQICKNLLDSSYLKMQFFDYMGYWRDVDYPEVVRNTPQIASKDGNESDTTWYDDENGWTGSTGSGEYVSHMIPTSLIRGDFPQDVQFRFVYTTPQKVSGSSFGDGVAIDNFRVGRARRAVDVGVTDIVYPVNPKFGETIYPTVKIKNYGTDSISNFEVGYLPWGTYLPMEARCELTIQPDSEILYTFPDPFIVTNNFPDTFSISAFTKPATDYYWDNDTCTKSFTLTPLPNDLQMLHILKPMESAVAGDSIPITVVIRNFGTEEVDECDVYYTYNGGTPVREHIRFADYLGQNLQSTETFSHTFTSRQERATMGTMRVTAYCDYARDEYRYNDTLSKTSQGRAAITDLEASHFFFDTRDHSGVRIGLSVSNVGARAVSRFHAGFFVDRDTSTIHYDSVTIDPPLPAGSRMVYLFDTLMPTRTSPWEYCTAWLTTEGDTCHSNDTTQLSAEMNTDLSLQRVEVEENRYDSCRVRFVIRNEGNITFYKPITMQFTINGLKTKATIPDSAYFIQPGETRHIMMVKNNKEVKIPKSATRQYTGTGQLLDIDADNDPRNNKTDLITVCNYFEGITPVEGGLKFDLEQNEPNPFVETTSIGFTIPAHGKVSLTVTDALGRQVYEMSAVYDEGRHTLTFDRSRLAAGVYYYTVEYDGESQMRKMIVR